MTGYGARTNDPYFVALDRAENDPYERDLIREVGGVSMSGTLWQALRARAARLSPTSIGAGSGRHSWPVDARGTPRSVSYG